MARIIDDTEIDTQIEQDSDEEIQHHHDLERQNLMGQVHSQAKKPSCRRMFCKGLVLSTAGVLFLLMMIQLWSDYGEYIETQTFPPRMVSMGRYCQYKTEDSYKPLDCVFFADLVCQATPPEKYFIETCPQGNVSWTDDTLVVTPFMATDCINLVVWSI
jgi:hypothetical protein